MKSLNSYTEINLALVTGNDFKWVQYQTSERLFFQIEVNGKKYLLINYLTRFVGRNYLRPLIGFRP